MDNIPECSTPQLTQVACKSVVFPGKRSSGHGAEPFCLYRWVHTLCTWRFPSGTGVLQLLPTGKTVCGDCGRAWLCMCCTGSERPSVRLQIHKTWAAALQAAALQAAVVYRPFTALDNICTRLFNRFKTPADLNRGCPVLSDPPQRSRKPQTLAFYLFLCPRT